MNRALIVSLNFNPGHVSHLLASYNQLKEIGYSPVLLIHPKFVSFIPSCYSYIVKGDKNKDNIKLAIYQFPSLHNIFEIIKLKIKYNSKIIYIHHEPLEPLNTYIDSGFSIKSITKLLIINFINIITLFFSNIVLLPSKKAINLYDKNPFYRNKNRYYVPLMYNDENNESTNSSRKYFSYIGTIASDHSFLEFIKFVRFCIDKNEIIELDFLIATRSNIPNDIQINDLAKSGRLHIVAGNPLSNTEINNYYKSSFIVWNAYERTTQSGVLAKAFMFGTPAIILSKNKSEFVENGVDVIMIENNKDVNEILKATKIILTKFENYSINARNRFEKCFYYKSYNNIISFIITNNKRNIEF